MIDILFTYPLELISKVNAMLKGSKVPNQKLYINLGNELTRIGDLKKGLNVNTDKIIFKKILKSNGINDLSNISAEDVFEKNGLLNKVYPNFEERPNQIKYSKHVEDVLTGNGKFGVIEAGTGLGKSMAYLSVHLKVHMIYSSGPTVIACHTKPLQDQLFFKDLPQLSEALSVPIKVIMLKGEEKLYL